MTSPGTVEEALDARRTPWLRTRGQVLDGRDVLGTGPAGGGTGPLRVISCADVAAVLSAVVRASRDGAVALLWPDRVPVPGWLAALAALPAGSLPIPLAAAVAGAPLVGVASSGTTGRGKVVLLDQARALANASAIAGVLGGTFAGAGVASLRDTAYAAGFVGDLLSTLVAEGATYLPPVVASPVLAARAVRTEAVDGVHASTAVAGAVAADLPDGVRHVVLSGDRLAPAAVATLRARFRDLAIWSGYGLAEAGPRVTLGRCPAQVPSGYAGPPLPGVSITTDGEISVRTPYQAVGVVGPEGYRPLPDDGTPLATGDAGHLDDGALVVAGRLAGSTTVQGVPVFPEEIETALSDQGIVATVDLDGDGCRVVVASGDAANVRPALRRAFPLLPHVDVVLGGPVALSPAGKVRR